MAATTLLHKQIEAGGVLPNGVGHLPPSCASCHPLVLHFGRPQQEYQAATTTTAVFDLSDRTQIEITGKDRQRFLHNYCTNDIKGLEPGSSCEAFVTNGKSRVLAHIFVFAGADSFWVDGGLTSADALIAHLGRYVITADVQLLDRTDEYGELLVSGPAAPDHLARLGLDCQGVEQHQHVTCNRNGCRLDVRRVDLLGQPGLLLSTARSALVSLWRDIVEAGATPAGAEAFHACRIEAGLPLYGLDLSADHLAPEAARSGRAISLTKGCYLGQEPIARIDARGHLNRELRGVALERGPTPKPGDKVVSEDNRKIGAITSAAVVPGTEGPIALAYLRHSHTTPESNVRVRIGDIEVPAKVFGWA